MTEDVPGYRVLEQVGEGGFSVVYRAHQERLDRMVALKVLSISAVDDGAMRRFQRECKITGRLSGHPNVVTVLDTGTARSGRPFIAMEYFEHGAVADRLAREGPLPVAEVLRIGVKMAGALAATHETDVLHRDVKPQNILVSKYGEPALADFGIARLVDSFDATHTQAFTPHHAAPEVLEGRTPGVGSDIYSLGSTLYQLLAGHPAFKGPQGEGIAQLMLRILNDPPAPIRRPDVQPQVLDVISRAMAKTPEERYGGGVEFAQRLQRLQHELGLPVTEMAHSGGAGGATGLTPAPAAAPPLPPAPGPPSPPAGAPPAFPMPEQDRTAAMPGTTGPGTTGAGTTSEWRTGPPPAEPPSPWRPAAAQQAQQAQQAQDAATAAFPQAPPPAPQPMAAPLPPLPAQPVAAPRPGPAPQPVPASGEAAPNWPPQPDTPDHTVVRRDGPQRRGMVVTLAVVLVGGTALGAGALALRGGGTPGEDGGGPAATTAAVQPSAEPQTSAPKADGGQQPIPQSQFRATRPRGVKVKAAGSRAVLVWKVPTAASRLPIIVQTLPAGSTPAVPAGVGARSATVSGLDPGAGYCFRVGAVLRLNQDKPATMSWSQPPVCVRGARVQSGG